MSPYSIDLFHELDNVFIQQFQNNIGLSISLTDLMHCKKGLEEKVTNSIDRFKHLHAQVSHHVPDLDIQHIFIINLQKGVKDKIMITEFTSFLQLCVALHYYQLQVSQFEITTQMAHVLVDKSDATPNHNKF